MHTRVFILLKKKKKNLIQASSFHCFMVRFWCSYAHCRNFWQWTEGFFFLAVWIPVALLFDLKTWASPHSPRAWVSLILWLALSMMTSSLRPICLQWVHAPLQHWAGLFLPACPDTRCPFLSSCLRSRQRRGTAHPPPQSDRTGAARPRRHQSTCVPSLCRNQYSHILSH